MQTLLTILGCWVLASIVAAPLIGRTLRARSRSYEGRHRR